jgi:hypothetical protein
MMNDLGELPVEIVHLYTYDIGRAIDLKKVASLVPRITRSSSRSGAILPFHSLSPSRWCSPSVLTNAIRSVFEKISAQAKIYEDAAVSDCALPDDVGV